MNKSFSFTEVHSALVDAGIVVYEAAESYQSACTLVMQLIDDARNSLAPSEFGKWATAEFGSGGPRKADGYVAGAWPTALRKAGYLMQRSATKADVKDSAANRVNTFVSDVRAIVRKCAEDATFEFADSFRATYKAARAGDEPEASDGEAAGKADTSATKPSAVSVITAEQGRAWVKSSPLDALDVLRRYLIERKDSIRAATIEAVASQLAEANKAEAEAKIKAEVNKNARKSKAA